MAAANAALNKGGNLKCYKRSHCYAVRLYALTQVLRKSNRVAVATFSVPGMALHSRVGEISQVPRGPTDGNPKAKPKGVHREGNLKEGGGEIQVRTHRN